ncbi:MAG: hypothetical protein LBQ81_13250, partial [Zoogloeaceae bacterium]|nr:hypothetical protein [Zoogloeaceae bacterium]
RRQELPLLVCQIAWVHAALQIIRNDMSKHFSCLFLKQLLKESKHAHCANGNSTVVAILLSRHSVSNVLRGGSFDAALTPLIPDGKAVRASRLIL